MARRKKLMCMELPAAGYDTHEDLFCDRYADRKAKEMAVLARVPFCQKLKRLLQPLPGLVLASAATTYEARTRAASAAAKRQREEENRHRTANRAAHGPEAKAKSPPPGPHRTSSPSQLPNGQWPMGPPATSHQEPGARRWTSANTAASLAPAPQGSRRKTPTNGVGMGLAWG
jgi:hypothetical protein